MKKLSKILVIIGLSLLSQLIVTAQTGKITLSHAGNLSFFTSAASAISASADGDTIYLPGGHIQGNSVTINKRLAIIGAGHYPDSTVATTQTNFVDTVYIVTGADYGSLSGSICLNIIFGTNSTNQNVNTYKIERCRIGKLQLGFNSSNASNSISIIENVISGINNIYGGTSVLFEKNIIRYNSNQYASCYTYPAVFNNNIIESMDNSQYKFIQSILNNNIFINPYSASPITFGSNSDYNYNLFCNRSSTAQTFDFGQTNSNYNNIFGQLASNTFMNFISTWGSGGTFSYSNNFHLKPTSPGKNAGNDGNDIGIYGTFYPYKEAAVPANPHIGMKNISPSTNASGTLQIDIKVSAQDR